jgi:Uma2 family endonuclease
LGEFDHGHLQGLLFSWFLERLTTTRLIPVVEQRIRVSERNIRICDVAVVSADSPREQVTTSAPAICIEILSPEDRIARAELVLSDYREMGVPNVWLIDPFRRAAYFFNDSGLHHAVDNTLHITGADLSLEMDSLFLALDETKR